MYLFSVALTACSNGERINSGNVVKFPNVQSHYGLQNVTLFKQNGTFTCEQDGLYMFFSNMVSNAVHSYFTWYLNSTRLSFVAFSHHPDFQSGSGMVILELVVGDTVSLVSLYSNIYIDPHSCYTLIKIK